MAQVQSYQYSDPVQGQAPAYAQVLAGLLRGGANQVALQQQNAAKDEQNQFDLMKSYIPSLASTGQLGVGTPGPGQGQSLPGIGKNPSQFFMRPNKPLEPLNALQQAQMRHADSAAKLNQFKMDHPEQINPFINDLWKLSQADKNTREESNGILGDFFKKKNPLNKKIEDATTELINKPSSSESSPSVVYHKNQIINKGGRNWVVTGFDPNDGHPLVDPAEGANTYL